MFNRLLLCCLLAAAEDALMEPRAWLRFADGGAQPVDEKMTLVRETEQGGVYWHRTPVPCGVYELAVDLETHNVTDSPDSPFEGVAVWFLPNATLPDLTRNSLLGGDRSLFEYRSDFRGFAAFLSVMSRQKLLKPSASVLFNDGETLPMSEVPTEFGVYYNFLTQPDHLSLKFVVNNTRVTTQVTDGRNAFRTVSSVAGHVKVCGYLGISATNKRAGKKGPGAEVRIRGFSFTSEDENLMRRFERDPSDPLEEHEADAAGDSLLGHVAAALEEEQGHAAAKLGPKQIGDADIVDAPIPVEEAVAEVAQQQNSGAPNTSDVLQSPGSSNANLPLPDGISGTDPVDLARAYRNLDKIVSHLKGEHLRLHRQMQKLVVAVTADSKKIHEAAARQARDQQARLIKQERTVKELRDALMRNNESGMAESNRSIQSLKENAAFLESTVRTATLYSTYFAGGLLVSFLAFGGVIYKRMKDMEKKHFL